MLHIQDHPSNFVPSFSPRLSPCGSTGQNCARPTQVRPHCRPAHVLLHGEYVFRPPIETWELSGVAWANQLPASAGSVSDTEMLRRLQTTAT